MTFKRASGVLLHPTSLPGPYGIGDIGAAAFEWVNFLASAGCSIWQLLPLGPTGYGDSPYQCFSAFAGNPYLISTTINSQIINLDRTIYCIFHHDAFTNATFNIHLPKRKD